MLLLESPYPQRKVLPAATKTRCRPIINLKKKKPSQRTSAQTQLPQAPFSFPGFTTARPASEQYVVGPNVGNGNIEFGERKDFVLGVHVWYAVLWASALHRPFTSPESVPNHSP